MLPADLTTLNPSEIMEMLNFENCPLAKLERPISVVLPWLSAWIALIKTALQIHGSFNYHSRAAAWFGKWPRRGVEVDNFVDSNTYQSFDGSHLCHQDNCIIHLYYEAAWINLSRIDCKQCAKSLRSQGKPIPEKCEKHEPGCLMQVRTVFDIHLNSSMLI
jgi:hypothetical protein